MTKITKILVPLDGTPLAGAALPPARTLAAAMGPGLGARAARLAEESEFASSFPDCEVGAMPPFGNLYGLPVYVDASLGDDERIVFQAGTHTDTMRVTYADFVRLVNPTVVTVARRRQPVTVLS